MKPIRTILTALDFSESSNSAFETAIVELAEKIGADLIVMGTQGHTVLRQVLLGSVAERSLRHAPCSVLTVKAPFG